MAAIDMTCPACGARLQLDDRMRQAFCTYCGHQMILERGQQMDEEDYHEAGYQFEMGRIRAQREEEQREAERAEQAARDAEAARIIAEKTAARERRISGLVQFGTVLLSVVFFWLMLPEAFPAWAAIPVALGIGGFALFSKRFTKTWRLVVLAHMALLLLVKAL